MDGPSVSDEPSGPSKERRVAPAQSPPLDEARLRISATIAKGNHGPQNPYTIGPPHYRQVPSTRVWVSLAPGAPADQLYTRAVVSHDTTPQTDFKR